jgi:hypothetical protein
MLDWVGVLLVLWLVVVLLAGRAEPDESEPWLREFQRRIRHNAPGDRDGT